MSETNRFATSPLSRQGFRPVNLRIEPRGSLSASGALVMER